LLSYSFLCSFLTSEAHTRSFADLNGSVYVLFIVYVTRPPNIGPIAVGNKHKYIYICKFRIYKTIILPVVLYGCETWSLTLRKEHRLRVSENRVLRMFGPKRDEVTGEWRKVHNEELHDLYSSPSVIRIIKAKRMRWAGHVAQMEEKKNAFRLLMGKPEGTGPLGSPRRSWWDNIRMDLVEVGCGDVDWIGLVQDRDRWRALVNSVLNLRAP
jgi:hypothetical protein